MWDHAGVEKTGDLVEFLTLPVEHFLRTSDGKKWPGIRSPDAQLYIDTAYVYEHNFEPWPSWHGFSGSGRAAVDSICTWGCPSIRTTCNVHSIHVGIILTTAGTPSRSSKSSTTTSELTVSEAMPMLFTQDELIPKFLLLADNLKNGKFHQHLRDTFAPQVIRYVDLMESSIAQSIHKGFEKERWEIKGWVDQSPISQRTDWWLRLEVCRSAPHMCTDVSIFTVASPDPARASPGICTNQLRSR